MKARKNNSAIRSFFKTFLAITLVLSIGPGFTWANNELQSAAEQRAAEAAANENPDGVAEDVAYLLQEAESIVAEDVAAPAENVAEPITADTIVEPAAEATSNANSDDSATAAAADSAQEEGTEAADAEGEATTDEEVTDEADGEEADEEADDEDSEGVWTIGKKQYESLAAAVEAAKDGDTIVLSEDVADAAATIINGKTLAIDLGGHTVSGANISKKSIISLFDSANVSIANGTITGGQADWSWGGHAWRDDNAGAIAAERSTLNINNVTFVDNKEIGSSYNSAKDISAWECTLNVSNCTFTNTALVDNQHAAISAERTPTTISGCTFTHQYRALHIVNCPTVDVSDSSFTNQMPDGTRGTYKGYITVVGSITAESNASQYATFTNCTIADNNTYSDNYDTALIELESAIDAPNAFNVAINNCTITNNSVLASSDRKCNYIIKAYSSWGHSPLNLTLENTLVANNTANHATIRAQESTYVTLNNSVVKNNVAKGSADYSSLSGGICFSGKSLTLNNSALYNNVLEKQSDFSPAKANDLLVDDKSSQINIPAAADMVDFIAPDYDFSELVWKDGGKSGYENAPAVTSANKRYYTVTDKNGLSVARIGENIYESVEDAFSAAVSGDTIEIIADAIRVSVEKPIAVDKDVTLALEDHNIIYGGQGDVFDVQPGATLTITNVQSERYNINSNANTDVEGGIETGSVTVEDGGKLVLADPMVTNGITNNGDLAFNAVQKKADITLGKDKFVELGEAYDTATSKDSKLTFTLDPDIVATLNDGTSGDV